MFMSKKLHVHVHVYASPETHSRSPFSYLREVRPIWVSDDDVYVDCPDNITLGIINQISCHNCND